MSARNFIVLVINILYRFFMDLSKVFDYQGYKVRTVVVDGAIWFVAKDVCDVLGLGDVSKATSRLDEDERGTNTVRTPSGDQSMLVISEPGLYSLILTSRKEEAKRFKKWVTAEVLPAIRMTGEYSSHNMTNAELILKQAQELVAHERVLKVHDAKLGEHEQRIATLEGGAVPAGYYSVKRFSAKHGLRLNASEAIIMGKRASALCAMSGIARYQQNDENFDKVWTYPEYILQEIANQK